MEWVSENWLFLILAAVFIGMHLTGRGCHGGHGGHADGEGHDEHEHSDKGPDDEKGGGSCH